MRDAWMMLSERCNEKISKLEDSERSALLHNLKVNLEIIKEQEVVT